MIDFHVPTFLLAAPELFIASMALAVLLATSFARSKSSQLAHWLTSFALLTGAVLTILVNRNFSGTIGRAYRENSFSGFFAMWPKTFFDFLASGGVNTTFGQFYLADPLGDLLKVAICLTVFIVLIYSRRYLKERKFGTNEYYVIMLLGTLGIMVIISSGNLLTIYVGLELLSLSSYALVAINRDSVISTEAAMKYFVLGALASGLLLYGMSMIYGATRSLDLLDIARSALEPAAVNSTLPLFGLIFIVAGVSFKLGVVPFHMWVPDVYEGAPTAVTAFIASASKVAAFAIACRLLSLGLWNLADHWKFMLLIMATASIILGNVAAILQTNLKRMLAYSGISHMGFLLLGFSAHVSRGPNIAYPSALFYVITYVLAVLAAFGVILLISRNGFEAERIDDYRGLAKRNPLIAGIMAITMLSMAGLPIFVGFFAKFFVLQALWLAGYPWLTVLAVLFSLVGAFYYLQILKVMYFDEPSELASFQFATGEAAILSLNAMAIVLFGVFPGALMQLCTMLA